MSAERFALIPTAVLALVLVGAAGCSWQRVASQSRTHAPRAAPPAHASRRKLLPEGLIGRIPTRLPTSKRVVALTFDAGANNAGLPKILRTLDRLRVRGTFFVTGHFARYYPGWVRRLSARYPIANHTMNHVDLDRLSDGQVRAEVLGAARAIRAVTGKSPEPFFRFPYGIEGPRTLAIVNRLGYAALGWTADTGGWLGPSGGQSVTTVLARALSAVRPGAILLMHVGSNPADGSTLDADALPAIIARIERRGYRFTTLQEAYATAYPGWKALSTGDAARPSRAHASSGMERFIRLGRPIYCGSTRRRYVALTFDDGPGPETAATIRLLRRFHNRATFFLVGRNLAARPKLPREELRTGAVGDHTWTHPFLTRLPLHAAESEIVRTQRALERATGAPVELFRPPYGFHEAAIDRLVRRLGMLEVLWSIDSHDSYPVPGADAAEIERTLRRLARPGSIMLLHENLRATAEALPVVLRQLRARHLRAVSIPELLALDPPSAAQLRQGVHGCPGANA